MRVFEISVTRTCLKFAENLLSTMATVELHVSMYFGADIYK
jgi:hypothetical protein